MHIDAIELGGATAAGPPAWWQALALLGDAAADGRQDPSSAVAPGGLATRLDDSPPRVLALSLTVRSPPAGPDVRLMFDGGFELRLAAAPATPGPASLQLDHVTVCVHPRNLDAYVGKLRDRLPASTCEYHDVECDATGMRIAAVADRDTGVHVVLAAPRGQSGQVADYLARTGCEGLQHLAFRVKSVRRSLDALARHGLRFIGSTAHRHDAMIEMRQGNRWLRQAFTEPLWGEFFIEIVERRGVSGLLAANMQSLYEMRERRPVSLSGARAPHP